MRRSPVIVALLALGTVCTLSVHVRAALVNRWAFEEPDGTGAPQVLDSVGGNHGTFSSMSDANRSSDLPTNAQSLNSTRSLSFGGGASNDAVNLASQISLAHNANWTVATWYKGTESGVNTFNTSVGGVLLGRDNNDIYANFVIHNGKASYVHYSGGAWQQFSSTTSVNDNQWHHLAIVHYSNSTAQIYVDGVLEGFDNNTALDIPTFPFRIDNMMFGYNGRYTQGMLDDARVYNHSLSNLEIKELLPEPGAMSLIAMVAMVGVRRKR
jgi:hypothetical protein